MLCVIVQTNSTLLFTLFNLAFAAFWTHSGGCKPSTPVFIDNTVTLKLFFVFLIAHVFLILSVVPIPFCHALRATLFVTDQLVLSTCIAYPVSPVKSPVFSLVFPDLCKAL